MVEKRPKFFDGMQSSHDGHVTGSHDDGSLIAFLSHPKSQNVEP